MTRLGDIKSPSIRPIILDNRRVIYLEKKGQLIMIQILRNLRADESGQDLIEYALVAALVGLGAVLAMKGLSNSIKNSFNGVGTSLTNA